VTNKNPLGPLNPRGFDNYEQHYKRWYPTFYDPQPQVF